MPTLAPYATRRTTRRPVRWRDYFRGQPEAWLEQYFPTADRPALWLFGLHPQQAARDRCQLCQSPQLDPAQRKFGWYWLWLGAMDGQNGPKYRFHQGDCCRRIEYAIFTLGWQEEWTPEQVVLLSWPAAAPGIDPAAPPRRRRQRRKEPTP